MMNASLQPSDLMSQAQTLADRLVRLDDLKLKPVDPPTGSFMAYRPNNLAESYRHGQGVAQILGEWQAEPALQAAGLLHSFVYKGVVSMEQVAAACGERAAFLSEEYKNILLDTPPPGRPRGKPQFIRRVKLYRATYRDPDLAFLSVASLWDHFSLARQSEPTLQHNFANEARTILIPVLDMSGMWELKEEVEAWIMQRGRNRQDYQYLLKRLAQTEENHRQAFELVKNILQPLLPTAQLARKVRTPVQIYDPQFPEKTHPEALQKLSVDVLVNTEDECYTALRWIHHFWKPVESSLSDYIGASKPNGYRCLQLAVMAPMESGQTRVHFHIRTHEMDRINRWGLTALHLMERRQVVLPQAWWSQRQSICARIDSAPLGALPETLYVFSPQGELFHFHRGCTVVDYAYQVHSELAHQCKRFRVNGEVVGPTTVLRHLDLIELERDPKFTGPTQVWLNAARTDRARSHIKRFLRRRGQGSRHGQTVFERQLQALKTYYRIDIPDYRVEQALNQVARRLKLGHVEDVLAEIAAGRFAANLILHPLFSEEITRQVQLPAGLRLYPHQLSLAQCCKPRPGDNIVGHPHHRDKEVVGLKVHRHNCPNITGYENNIPLTWRLQPKLNAVVRLEVTALDEMRLLDDTLQVIYQAMPQVALHKLDFVARNGIARLAFTLEAKNQALIDQITRDLEQLPGRTINEVRQMRLLFSEREELARPAAPTVFNPYRRLPVRDREMFFGRSEELGAISGLIQAGTKAIFVRGQKRVGKTSLLLYLKEHYLDRNSMVPIFIDFQMLSHLTGPAFFHELANAIYSELQTDHRISEVGPPLLQLFEVAPATELANYLRSVQSYFGATRLVLLLDEFSRTIDAYQQHRLEANFFQQWQGLLQTTTPNVNYIMVIQQQTYDIMLKQMNQPGLDPTWHLLEVGETLLLKPLSQKDAGQLIERPTHNYLDYSPEAVHYVWRLTGGSPFLIQVFCFNLVRYMARSGHRRVEWADIDAVQAEFMNPHESIFVHLLDMIRGLAQPVCHKLTEFLGETDQPLPITRLNAAFPQLSAERLQSVIQELVNRDILIRPEPHLCQFASLLFGRWLARNMALEQLMASDS